MAVWLSDITDVSTIDNSQNDVGGGACFRPYQTFLVGLSGISPNTFYGTLLPHVPHVERMAQTFTLQKPRSSLASCSKVMVTYSAFMLMIVLISLSISLYGLSETLLTRI